MEGPMRRRRGLSLSLALLLQLSFWAAAAAASVRAGVVLDLTSDVGRKSLTCVSMALDDFHKGEAGEQPIKVYGDHMGVRRAYLDIKLHGNCVGYQKGSAVEYWLKEIGFHKKNLLGYDTVEAYADALQRGSDNGGVSAIVDEIPYLKIFLSKYCEGYTMVGWPNLQAFPIGSPIVHDVSQATMTPAVQEEMAWIERKMFGDPGACGSESGSITSSRLGFSNFGGLFHISGITSGLWPCAPHQPLYLRLPGARQAQG